MFHRDSAPHLCNFFETRWGNPNSIGSPDLNFQMSYSPYERISRNQSIDIPALYVSTGMNDPRVPYWEPVKWVAKLRSVQANRMPDGTPVCINSTSSSIDRPLLLRVNSGGHFGSTGVSRIEALAEWYAFVLCLVGTDDSCGTCSS